MRYVCLPCVVNTDRNFLVLSFSLGQVHTRVQANLARFGEGPTMGAFEGNVLGLQEATIVGGRNFVRKSGKIFPL